tara:strand:- start:124 stop:843 length:720 start_codon:yes stop_codon:yes gene_type:complete
MRETSYHKIIPERVAILEKIKSITRKHTVHLTTKYANRKLELISYVVNPKAKETIMITAGCHGNEPAPVYALYNLLKKKITTKKRIIIIPCITPFGFCLNTHTNQESKNINRDFFTKKSQKETKVLKKLVKKFKPRFVLNMHEDPDEDKFFLYLEGKEYRRIAEGLVKTVKIDYYRKKKIHKDTVINGIIESPKRNTSFEDYLAVLEVPNICTETPGMSPLRIRIKACEDILKFVIRNC